MQYVPYYALNSDVLAVEFTNDGCIYVFRYWDGVSQWLFARLPGHQSTVHNPSGKSYDHRFFEHILVNVKLGTMENLGLLLNYAAGRRIPFCPRPASSPFHGHHIVKICMHGIDELDGANELDTSHTTHLVCEGATFRDMFNGVCGSAVRSYSSVKYRISSVCRRYSYKGVTHDKRLGQILDADRALRPVWFIPSPHKMTEVE